MYMLAAALFSSQPIVVETAVRDDQEVGPAVCVSALCGLPHV